MKPTSKLFHQLSRLPAFKAIAETGSFNSAAVKMGISQPSLSQSIQILESELGVQLFVRSSKGAVLSDEGRKLYQVCEKIFLDCHEVEKKISVTTSPIQRMVIGTKDPFAIHLWPKYVLYLMKHHPGISIDIVTNESNLALIKLLKSRSVDLIMISNPKTQDGLISYELFKTGYGIYQSSAVSETKDARPLLFSFTKSLAAKDKTIGQLLGKNISSKYEIRSINSFEVARALALSGLGAAILPQFIADQDVKQGLLKEMTFPNKKRWGEFSVCACVWEGDERTRFMRNLIGQIRNAHRNSLTN